MCERFMENNSRLMSKVDRAHMQRKFNQKEKRKKFVCNCMIRHKSGQEAREWMKGSKL